MKQISQRLINVEYKRRVAAFILSIPALFLRIARYLSSSSATDAECRDVLVFEPFAMGDVISMEPLLRVLSREGFKVHVCAKTIWRELIRKEYVTTWVESQIPWSDYSFSRKYDLRRYFGRDFKAFFRSLKTVARGSIGIDTRGDIRSVCFLYLAGCARVYSLSHYLGSNLKVPAYTARIIEARQDLCRWRMNLHFAHPFNISVSPDESGPSVNHLLSKKTSTLTDRVVLIPVSPVLRRCWPADKWQLLCKSISELGLTPAGLCGPGQLNKAQEFLGKIPVTECGSIMDWIKCLNECRAVVSVSTGPMHLADAMGKPIVVVDGSSKLPLWSPSGKNTYVIHHQDKLECAPCHHIDSFCPNNNECMNLITIDEVLKALRTIMGVS